ncbi:aspartic peptidase domain-containing protein [Phlebopus sp. FC_14]|nr:aspartic peptidase domain-containing protein [Phlebopus sp. FC_14]
MFSSEIVTLALVSSNVLLASNALVIHRDSDTYPSSFKGFPFQAKLTPQSNEETDNNSFITVTNDHNMEYLGKVDVGGHDFTLQIDTGSSDLWVTGVPGLKITKTANKQLNLTYGIGSAAGEILYADVSFGGYNIQNQAFLNATSVVQQDGQGILGLGFIALSPIAGTIKDKSGLPVMANIFNQNPHIPMFLGLALERSKNGEDTSGGVLSIGQYDPDYSNVARRPKYPIEPSSSSRWTIAISDMRVNGKSFSLQSSVKGAKKGTVISLIDSGTSLAYIPSQAVDAIYGSIEGAVHVKTKVQDAWFVPCLGQANLSFTFGQDTYPINPMELTTPSTISDRGTQYTVCMNAFRAPLNGKFGDVDFLLGDIFMRNVYSVFNFGNSSAKGEDSKGASIQFLSRTDRDQAYRLFEERRKESLKSRPPLFDLSKLHTDGTTDGGQRLNP